MSDVQGASCRSWRNSILTRMPPKLHIWLLTFILLVGFARGMYWVVTTEVWNLDDEAQHYGYVESLARGDGIPVIGKDKLQLDARGVAKASPTMGFRSYGMANANEQSDWGAFGHLYEGGGYQGPLYYALLVPTYWVTDPLGTVASIYALRMATLLILLTAVPLLWLLARRLFPDQPTIWIASPAILVVIQGVNSNASSITNDALILPMAIAALIPVADMRRGINNRQALIAGVLFGLALLCKNTASPLAVLTLVVLAALVVSRRAPLRDSVTWGLIYAGTALVVLAPYLAWNLHSYGALSASAQVSEILTPAQPHIPNTLDGLRTHLRYVLSGLWDFQPYSMGPSSTYARTFEITMLVSVVAATAVTLRRRAFDDAATLIWLAIAFPVAFVLLLAGTLATYNGASTIVGRHLYGVLGLFAIAIAAGICLTFGPRLRVLAILMLIGVAFISERQLTDHLVVVTFTDGVLFERLAPVVDQPLNEGYTTARSVSAIASCPVEAIGLAIVNPAPNELTVSALATQRATYFAENKAVAIYTLATPATGQITIFTPGLQVGRESVGRDAAISLDGATGDPVIRLYCEVDNPDEFRFKQMFYPGHLDLSYSLVRAWADVWYWIGWSMVAASAGGMAFLAYDELRRRYNPSGLHK